MTSQPLPSPTIAPLGAVLPRYGEFRFGRVLDAAQSDIGNEPDLSHSQNRTLAREGWDTGRTQSFPRAAQVTGIR